jgi:hypothetical protein
MPPARIEKVELPDFPAGRDQLGRRHNELPSRVDRTLNAIQGTDEMGYQLAAQAWQHTLTGERAALHGHKQQQRAPAMFADRSSLVAL